MKLYILKLNEAEAGPDVTREILVRAPNAAAARKLASATKHGDEGQEAWVSTKRTSCRQVSQNGKPGVLMVDAYEG